MSCTCRQPVRPEFKDSYNDLLDKPKINGVTLSGNLTAADLGIKAGVQFKIVPQLPVTDIDDATIYLVPVQVGQTDNIYQEWIYINNKWEKIGEPINIQGAGGTNVRVLTLFDIGEKYIDRNAQDIHLNTKADINRLWPWLNLSNDELVICTHGLEVLIYFATGWNFYGFQTSGVPFAVEAIGSIDESFILKFDRIYIDENGNAFIDNPTASRPSL